MENTHLENENSPSQTLKMLQYLEQELEVSTTTILSSRPMSIRMMKSHAIVHQMSKIKF